MCGRITQVSPPDQLSLLSVSLVEDVWGNDRRARYKGAPGQKHWVLRQHPQTGRRSLDRLVWGLIPHGMQDGQGGPKPINAMAETVATKPMFRDAFRRRRCVLPVDSFFEWRRPSGQGPRQPFAVGRRDRRAFGLAAIWENWKNPKSGDWTRTFAVITCPANDLVARIHNRMPVILGDNSLERWLSPAEVDPRDLTVPFPSAELRVWRVSGRVNNVADDDPAVLEPPDEMVEYGG